MKFAILGVGLIGGSLGLCLKKSYGDKIFVTGLCRTEESMNRAVHLGAVDFASYDLEKVVGDADFIFLSPPVLQIVPLVEKILPYIKAGAILTDAGSTKKYICDELKKILPPDIFFVAGHPMAGREKSGVSAATADLFRNKAYVLVTDKDESAETVDARNKLVELLKCTGARFLLLDVEKHDRNVSAISHVPHIAASALVHLLEFSHDDIESCSKMIGGGFKDTTRIASSNADMWTDVCLTNSEAIVDHLENLQLILKKISDDIRNRDRNSIHKYFADGKKLRDNLLENINFDPN